MSEHFDIVVAGAGIAGRLAALGFAQNGYEVAVVDPARVDAPTVKDHRSTAYLAPSVEFLTQLNLWPSLGAQAIPLRGLRVVDTKGTPPVVTAERVFDPADAGLDAFGWNLPNWQMIDLLGHAMDSHPAITAFTGDSVRRVLTRNVEAIVTLSDTRQIRARLVVGADGRDSMVRQQADIPTRIARYGQKALAFEAAHSRPHNQISTEVYNQGGAFTTVPLADQNARPRSSIVWMMDGPDALRMTGAPEDLFNQEMTARSIAILGDMTRLTKPALWPIVTQTATRLTAERIALIAEAAHVLPPIGAQGLNSSIADIQALVETAGRHAPGSAEHLAAYERKRHTDISTRGRVIDLYNRLCRSGKAPVQAMRSLGLEAAHDVVPIRQQLMQAGLGAR